MPKKSLALWPVHQESTVTMLEARSGAMAPTAEARLTVASMGEQMEEGAAGVPVVDVTWLGMAVMSQVETA
jgi:hypothetical protein